MMRDEKEIHNAQRVSPESGVLTRRAENHPLRRLEDEQADGHDHSSAGEISRGLLHIIMRRRKLILATVVLFLVASGLYILKATPMYLSSSKLCMERTGMLAVLNSDMMITESKNYLNTQVVLIKSTPIVAEAVSKGNLKSLKTFIGVDNLTVSLGKNLVVTVGKKDDVITVSYESPYPKDSAKVVNTIVKAYMDSHSRKRLTTSKDVLRILEREKKTREIDLQDKHQKLTDFRKRNETLAFGTQQKSIVIVRLLQLSDAVTNAEMELISVRAVYEPLVEMIEDDGNFMKLVNMRHGLPKEGPAYDEVMTIQDELVKLELQLEQLLQTCTSSHPSVKAHQNRMKRLSDRRDRKVREVATMQLESLRRDYLAALKQYDDLNKSFNLQKDLARQLNTRAAEYAMLELEIKRIERFCDVLYDKIKKINIGSDTGSMNISILEVARPTERPSSPRKARIMGISMLAGLIIAVLLAMFLEWMDYRLRSAEEVSPLLGVTVMGVLPRVVSKQIEGPIARVTELEPTSLISESFRTIRTAAFFGIPAGGKTLLVTSPEPSEGKSFVCSNLALAMAQAGHKVLLLEADLRKPVQARNFGFESEGHDLCGVLAGRCTVDEAIRSHGVEHNLDILPCVQHVHNPSELIGSCVFGDLLETLSQKYDQILIDSPPILPVADARIIASIADATILVLRAGKSSRKLSEHAVRILRGSGARILGAVMNDIRIQRSSRNYGYGYDYSYAYKADEGPAKKSPKKLEKSVNEPSRSL
ncbi:MAG TPA: polysaccharide biosynthesis tyrosine autokinase [Phycisphaerae bacterium]|nr:polysaccharide biosynthesis tyrosine autokinase [Phycisphaerae bacterium]